MIALYRAELLSRWRMLAGLAAGLFAFMLVMASTYRSLGLDMLGTAFSTHTPKAISAFAGTPDVDLLSPEGWLGFGFAHPMFLLLSAAVAIAVPAASIAGAVETGRAEMLFVRPVTRRRLLAVSAAVWATGQVLVGLGALAGTLLGSAFDADIAGIGVGALAVTLLLGFPLFACIAGLSFLASARTSTRGAAVGVAIAATAGAYLINFLSGIVDGLGWLRWCGPFGYYSPAATLGGDVALGHAAVLLGCAGVLFLGAAISLDRRDLR